MDRQLARNLIRETFENMFDKGRFTRFIKDLLNHIEEAPFTYQGQYIPDAYKVSISSLERIGKFNDGENRIDILIIKLQKETSLERARTMQRNFVAWYLNGSRGGKLKDAALVAFVSPDEEDWRFSLVKMDYKFEQTKTGKIKVKEEFTPARRWSFLVGANENSHTAQSRLVNILANDEHDPPLTELEQAFDIETVTKEFFIKYRELFIRTKEELDKVVKNDTKVRADFDKKGVNTVDFAKKLLGQITFLYFLQKKGWFGVGRDVEWGTGSKHFLRELFLKKHANYKNFFNDILEPLFYEALAIERAADFYSRFNCKIPFLNGGLFDPINNYDWVHTDILLPDQLFSNKIKTKEGDIGTGILDVFDRYNFTVKEDEPLEKEVAVDPEMLGKVFENLLEVKDRKSKGTYYTPREIVHYMCQESLANYLATELKDEVSKEDIETLIKYGETSVEHDAMYIEKKSKDANYKGRYDKAKLPNSIEQNAKLIDEKLASTHVCDPAVGSGAFLVGTMNEIIRTRNALTSYIGKDGERTPYNFKRHAIQNCLYGVDIDPGAVEIAKLRLWLSLMVDEEDIKHIKPLPNLDYKIVCGNSLLGVNVLFHHSQIKALEELKGKYFEETNVRRKEQLKTNIDQLIKEITNNDEHFDFNVYFSEVFQQKGGFDIVVANPPYKLIGADKPREQKIYKKNYKMASYKINTYVLFLEKGLSLLTSNDSIISYIIPKSLVFNTYLKQTRTILLSKYAIPKIIEIIGKVFEHAEVGDNIIFFAQTSSRPLENFLQYSIVKNVMPFVVVENFSNEQKVLINNYDSNFHNKLKILGASQKLLSDFANISNGLNPGNVRHILLSSSKDSNKHKKMILGKDIKRYGINWSGTWVNYDINLKNTLSMSDVKSKKGMTAQKKVDFALRKENIFCSNKIVIRKTSDHIVANYDSEGFYFDSLSYGIHLKKDANISILYLLGLLNSKYLNYIHEGFSLNKGKVFAKVLLKNLAKLPIYAIDFNNKAERAIHDNILSLVNQILTAKQNDPPADTLSLEKEINHLVYKLYGLTPEEITIVEGRAGKGTHSDIRAEKKKTSIRKRK